jgi:hypothetical protein
MKLQALRTAMLATMVLVSPAVSLAAASGKVGIVRRAEAPNPADLTKAVQFGKGTGMTRNDQTLKGNAFRSQTDQDRGAVRSNSDRRPNSGDFAFRK